VLTGITERADPSLATRQGQWQTTPHDCRHWGVCDCCQARHCRWKAQKTAESTLYTTDAIWRIPHPHLEFGYMSPISRRRSPWGSTSCAHTIHLCTYGAKCYVLQRKRHRYGAPAFQPGCGQWSGDTCKIQGSGNGSIGEHPRNGKWLHRTESGNPPTEGLNIARTLVRNHWEVPMRVLNTTRHDQKLRKGSSWHNVSQSHWWPHPMLNNHRFKTLPWSCRMGLQQPCQTWVTLNPES
jgi:hypothetical protein